MSHRTHPSDKRGFFIRLPDDVQLPLYSSHSGYSIRDESLSERVQRALLHDYHHPDAITKRYHLLALDNPVGSGYSYTSSGAYVTSEFEMRTQAVAALRVFFQRHPEYTSRPFWVTGESYAGHYVPNIAWEVAVNASEIPLQGVVIGNGVRRIPRLERRRQSQRLRSTSSSPPACATPSATMRADVQHGAAVPERRADGVRRGRHRRGDARGGEHAAGPVRRNDPLAPGQRRPVLRERDRLLAVPG